MIFIKGFLKINPLIVPVVICCFLFGRIVEFVMMFAILTLHEIAHLIALKNQDITVYFIKIEPFGIGIYLKDTFLMAPKKEIISAFWGPFINILTGTLAYLFSVLSGYTGYTITFFIYSSLSIGFFNLIPALPLDGGRILRAFLSQKRGAMKAHNFVTNLTLVIALLMFMTSVMVIVLYGFSYTFCIIAIFLCFQFIAERRTYKLYMMRELAQYKQKYTIKETIPVKYIAVHKNLKARQLLKHFTGNAYYIVHITEGTKIIATLTEGEIIDGILNTNAQVTISDLELYQKRAI